MSERDFGRFVAWALTFTFLAAGAALFLIGLPLVLSGVVGLLYLVRRLSPSALRWFPLILAVSLFLIPAGYLWVNGNNSDIGSHNLDCLNYSNADERRDITSEPSLWPPGGKCVSHASDGTLTVHARDVPWAEWTGLAVLALMAGAGAYGYVVVLRAAQPA